ncbi:MAG: hypothetical protein ACYSWO_29270, partial [Planctomycetota bacterium]
MPRVVFPNGDALYFPEGVDEAAMQRASLEHWEKSNPEAQKVNISDMEPPPSAEMPSEAPGRPQAGSGPVPVPPPQPEAQTAAQGPPSAPDATIGANPDSLGVTRFGPMPSGMGDLFRGARDVLREVVEGGSSFAQGIERNAALVAGGQMALDGEMPGQRPGQDALAVRANEAAAAQFAPGGPVQAGITDKYEGANRAYSEVMGTPGIMLDEETKRNNMMLHALGGATRFTAHLAPYVALGPTMPASMMARRSAAKIGMDVLAKKITEKEGIAAMRALHSKVGPML